MQMKRKNAIKNGPGSSDYDENGIDKVNQNNQEGQVNIDILNGLIHLRPKNKKPHFLLRKWGLNESAHIPPPTFV
jgi:hypothetical protein